MLERALRGAALALVALLAWALFAPAPTPGRLDADPGDLRHLTRWTRQAPADTLHLALPVAPAPPRRAWLAALRGAGTVVTWSGAPPAVAVEVVPLGDPAGAARVLIAASDSALVRMRDGLGAEDSVRSAGGGAALNVPGPRGPVTASVGDQVAVAEVPVVVRRRAVVLGAAGWEARFVISALEERGWPVDARLAVAPGLGVTQGVPMPLDTARQAVVVVLDSLADADAIAVARYVRAGGGVVIGPGAAVARGGLSGVVPGTFGDRVRPATLSFAADAPKRSLALRPLVPRAVAVVLEQAPSGVAVAVAARREHAGRVVQAGYEDTWRWRMEGGADGPQAHREWWGDLAAAAAYRPERAAPAAPMDAGRPVTDPAPLASLVAALGPAVAPPPASRAPLDPRTFVTPLFAALLTCLLGEWTSRRLRGAA